MPILKEVFYKCLEEAIEVGKRLDEFIEAAKVLRENEEKDVGKWENLADYLIRGGNANIVECKVRYTLVKSRWKINEKEKKYKSVERMIRDERKLERMASVERSSAFYEIIDDVKNDPMFKDMGYDQQERVADELAMLNMTYYERQKQLRMMSNKVKRLKEEKEAKNAKINILQIVQEETRKDVYEEEIVRDDVDDLDKTAWKTEKEAQVIGEAWYKSDPDNRLSYFEQDKISKLWSCIGSEEGREVGKLSLRIVNSKEAKVPTKKYSL